MNNIIRILLNMTFMLSCVDAIDTNSKDNVQEYRTYELIQDVDTGSYFFEMFVGTQMERQLMLIDTQANGTAIKYTGAKSGIFDDHKDSVFIEMIGGTIEGEDVTDQICLDRDEDICIDDFTFTMATDIEYPKVQNTQMSGVIPFNQYLKSDNPTLRLVPALYAENLFFQKTLQFDFKLDVITHNGEQIRKPSLITFNGDDRRNTRYNNFDEVNFIGNLMIDGKWLIAVDDAFINEVNIFQEFSEVGKSNAVIATALNTIKMPRNDFESLVSALNQESIDIKVTDGKLMGGQPCHTYKTIKFFTFKIFGKFYKIPLLFFAQDTTDSQCWFQFEQNDEYEKTKDDIITDEGVMDFETNNGYILGMPFLRAFMVFMDFEQNQIGFANKLNNYGAYITSDFSDKKGIPEPVNPETNGTGQGHHHEKGDRSSTHNIDEENEEGDEGMTIIIIAASVAIICCTLCLFVYYCYRRRQENNKMFASEQPDLNLRKQARAQKKKDKDILTASFIDRNNFAEF